MEDSSVNLLSMKMHTNENNNMLETQKIDMYECEKPLKPEKSVVITTRRTRVLFVIALILIGLAILSLIGAVVLVVRFSGKGQEKISSQNQTSFTTTITPKPSSSSPVQNTTSSSVPIETSTLTSTVISTTVTKKTSTSTVSISTTPVSVCDSEEFRCSDGSCIASSYVCDGKPHCPLADDEYRGCECSDKQFRCNSGQCIDARFRCDGVTQCHDRSDEYNCSNCIGFQCRSGQCLWSLSVKCNEHVDCLDLSDETNCGWRPGYRRCRNGMWINRLKFCNKIDDCFDNSDEEGCDAICNPMAEKLCGDNRTCILHEWSCDGFPDCPDGSDEQNCGTCKEDESQCSDYSCIPAQQVCDGIKQCAAGNDEVDCLRVASNDGALVSSGIVTVKSDDKFLPICSDVWSTKAADEICKYFGHRSSANTMFIPQATAGVTLSHGFMVLKEKDISLAANESLLAKFTKLPMCPAQKVVSVKCKPNGCGERKIEILTPFIVGGTISPKGKWPWMVSVSMLGQGICGGVVLNSRWILTAAHCVVTALANYTLTPHYYEITAGTISRQRTAGDQSQRRHVDKIVLHPKMRRFETGLTEWDIALFHLDFPLFYNDYLQPICLPEQDEVFPSNSQCYLAGWGYINPQEVMVNNLREGKMRLWSEDDCAQNGIDTELNTNATICAGYHSGAISSCKGDSGSPLMCADNQGHWTVVGVMSHGVNGCDGRTFMRSNRYARVSTAIDWIRQTTGD